MEKSQKGAKIMWMLIFVSYVFIPVIFAFLVDSIKPIPVEEFQSHIYVYFVVALMSYPLTFVVAKIMKMTGKKNLSRRFQTDFEKVPEEDKYSLVLTFFSVHVAVPASAAHFGLILSIFTGHWTFVLLFTVTSTLWHLRFFPNEKVWKKMQEVLD